MTSAKKLTPVRAIRLKCLDCCCGQVKEVRQCPITDCPLYGYRFGRRPKTEVLPEGGDFPAEDVTDEKTEARTGYFTKDGLINGTEVC